jgi:hypothetical protein
VLPCSLFAAARLAELVSGGRACTPRPFGRLSHTLLAHPRPEYLHRATRQPPAKDAKQTAPSDRRCSKPAQSRWRQAERRRAAPLRNCAPRRPGQAIPPSPSIEMVASGSERSAPLNCAADLASSITAPCRTAHHPHVPSPHSSFFSGSRIGTIPIVCPNKGSVEDGVAEALSPQHRVRGRRPPRCRARSAACSQSDATRRHLTRKLCSCLCSARACLRAWRERSS